MQITYSTEPTPGRANEDFVVTGDQWAVVLDGATQLVADTGCIHDVAWLVASLGMEMARSLVESKERTLAERLAGAIRATCSRHRETCDLTNPDSPSATVVAVRRHGSQLDYLVLADSPLILELQDRVIPILDDRTAHLRDYSLQGVRAARNQPGGFYVASTLPDAAYEAVQGSVQLQDVRSAALLSDGAARLVERFGRITWDGLMDVLNKEGPAELVRLTRQAENEELEGDRAGRRGKRHDDATAVLLTHLDES